MVLRKIYTISLIVIFCQFFICINAYAKSDAPSYITVGTVYASSGDLASASMPLYDGLKFWVHYINSKGGVYVKEYGKKIKVKLISYNDQSSTNLAGTLYNRLITKDHVDILTAGFGSIMTAPAVPIAEIHKKLLFDQVGTSEKFFDKNNPYVVDLDVPPTKSWAPPLNQVLKQSGAKKIAILYSTNDFTGPIAHKLKRLLKVRGINPVYFHGVPTSTSQYNVTLQKILSKNPQAIIELGYPSNDINFFKALKSANVHNKFVFAVYPGTQPDTLVSNVGAKILNKTFTYISPPNYTYKNVKFGLSAPKFRTKFKQWKGGHATVNYNTAAGYNTGVIIQRVLANADKINTENLRKTIYKISGNTRTLMGNFKISKTGAQIGEHMIIAEVYKLHKQNKIKLVPIYPPKNATAKPIFN